MELGLRNKIVLVTGASKGIGRAVAEAFAAEGSKVAITARGAEELQKTAGEISQNTGAEVVGIAAVSHYGPRRGRAAEDSGRD
jgi:3-oxoacyl-[acyl-carrier protein] reductase